MKGYVIYDGRAMVDPSDAAIFEACMDGHADLRQGLETWKDCDAVLVEYDCVGNELQNARIVGHLNEGVHTLLSKCSK